MKDFNLRALANTVWVFATVDHRDEQLFTALADAAKQRMKDFNSQNLVNTMWAFAIVGRKDKQLQPTTKPNFKL